MNHILKKILKRVAYYILAMLAVLMMSALVVAILNGSKL